MIFKDGWEGGGVFMAACELAALAEKMDERCRKGCPTTRMVRKMTAIYGFFITTISPLSRQAHAFLC
jgi:hypothetical protein